VHFEDIYPNLTIHNIILYKKNYSSPPLPLGLVPLPTSKDIQQFRGTQIVQEEFWSDSHLFNVRQVYDCLHSKADR
jgi:hypothetical protein